MSRLHFRILLVLLVVTITALAYAGTASAGWTWDGMNGSWTDDASVAS